MTEENNQYNKKHFLSDLNY